jgi:putative SOS response-associated peptidase YedK
MCGRYTLREYNLLALGLGTQGEEFSETPRFNIAPSQMVPIVRLDGSGQRVGDLVRWGLIPYWSKEKPKIQPINARAETVATSPMFRQAFARHRCLQLADGFYEWKKQADGKQPYFIHLASDAAFAFAGIWDRWNGEKDGEPVETCCHITTTPNETMRPIHDRMPVILRPEDYATWLNPETDVETLKAMLKPLADGELETHPVTRAVGSPKNDGPENVLPLTG